MPAHASPRPTQNRAAVVACLLATFLIALSQLPPLESFAAVMWGLALILFVGGVVAGIRSHTPPRHE